MNNPQLRQYQRDVINEFHRRVDEGYHRVILVAPTGDFALSAKTRVIRETDAELWEQFGENRRGIC